jgi:hypothetical protein
VADPGRGVGGQAIHLVTLFRGAPHTANNSPAPSIERLQAMAAERGLPHRERPMAGDRPHRSRSEHL